MSATNFVPGRIRLDGKEHRAHMLIEHPEPAYPAAALANGIEGTVMLDIVIGKDGRVQSVQFKSGDSLLADAALEAVPQWVYRPTRLNGIPVEVATQIEINFTLPRQASSK